MDHARPWAPAVRQGRLAAMTERIPPTPAASPWVEIDGRAAGAQDLVPVLAGYGHFTAMQVRGGRVRGLRRHLERLDGASRELFAAGLDGERVRAHVRHALDGAGRADASVRVNVFQPVDEPGGPVAVVVAVRPPAAMPPGPYRVKSVPYQRPAAHLKHVGGFGQAYFGRQVAAEGYDEALLVGPDGEIAEGAITNIGFVAANAVVWPQAPHLRGITLQVLEEALDGAGIAQSRRPLRLADVDRYDGAFLINSRGTALISRIDGTPVPTTAELLPRIGELYASVPWDVI
ncbi:Branched-chain amino acid aminotransferase/4-amino-4-deoxychorismate lyase [Actinacidiphila yanglinensis]|uniref:Branched-chain amino acid aminotransferase/4-amino-4-deoxychorismate lyase n=2 Tax=Actinacidiphila yanglinensis TaxID=310779 RepID=A0A1H5X926_9ACTN|nr:Branched-chain amino acid aminotransferase/4-amino-4-deoxychorismate lyase [Actinacidiphila yanglinensis]